jgi:hypothetical protein
LLEPYSRRACPCLSVHVMSLCNTCTRQPRSHAFVFWPFCNCPLVDSSSSGVPPLAVPQTLLLTTRGIPILSRLISQARVATKAIISTLHATCTAPRESGPCPRPYLCWISILGSFGTHSYVPLVLFVLDPPLSIPAFFLLPWLSVANDAAPSSRPCARHLVL